MTLGGPTPSAPSRPAHDPYAAFRIRDYRLYLAGSVLVRLGGAAQGLAIGWEMYERTGQPFALGMVGLVQAAPMLLLTLFAGYLADRFDRRRLMVLSVAGAVLTSLGLAWMSWSAGPIVVMYGLLLVNSVALTLGRPARTALLPQLVPREVFENAVAWRTSAGQVAGVAGPALGGLIIAFSVPAAYVASAACKLVFIGCLARLTFSAGPRAAGSASLGSVLAGVRYVLRRKVMLAAISLDLFAVLLGGAVYLLPVYAKTILHVGKPGLGWLRAAPAAGAFAMALLLAHRPPMKRAGRNMFATVAGFGVATIVFGLSRSFWLSMAMLFLTGAFDNVSVVVRHTLIQLQTPDAMRGRVSAVSAVFIGSSNQLGGFESGLVAQLFSPVVSVVSGGVGTLAVVAVMAPLARQLRRFGSVHEAGTACQRRRVPNEG